MKIWITTDTHFGHQKIEEYCGRPKGFEDLIFKSLEELPINDMLIHLGDFCFGQDEKWSNKFIDNLSHLKRILVKGNHDNKSNEWYLKHGWDFVCDQFSITFNGKKILFSHEPQLISNFDFNIHGHFHNTLPRLLREEWVVEGEKERNNTVLKLLTNKHILISLEETNYKPVLLSNII